jgi:hypothetical protein
METAVLLKWQGCTCAGYLGHPSEKFLFFSERMTQVASTTQAARWELIRRAGVDRLQSCNIVCAAIDKAIRFTSKERIDDVDILSIF